MMRFIPIINIHSWTRLLNGHRPFDPRSGYTVFLALRCARLVSASLFWQGLAHIKALLAAFQLSSKSCKQPSINEPWQRVCASFNEIYS